MGVVVYFYPVTAHPYVQGFIYMCGYMCGDSESALYVNTHIHTESQLDRNKKELERTWSTSDR